MPVVLLPEVLRFHAQGVERHDVPGATVGAALDGVFARFPAMRTRTLRADGTVWPYLAVFVDGAEVARDGVLVRAVGAASVIELVGMAEGGGRDVRMRGFEARASLDDAVAAALDGVAPLDWEAAPLESAAGRVLAYDVASTVDVPPFARSAMDGYAVRAEDTFGATVQDPARLELAGESMPGCDAAAVRVGPRLAVRIMTGAPVPAGADAVVPAEHAHEDGAAVLVDAPVSPAKNVGRAGEDVARGDVLLCAGRRLRAQDVGILASIGVARAPVVRRPRVRIVVSGNELLPPGVRPVGSKIADSNTPMLAALVARDLGDVESALRLPDDEATIREALAAEGADVILTSGGTSVGREDHVPQIVRALGRLDVHGIAMRPASPAGIGRIGATRVFLLPGNPVSCLAAYDLLAGPAIRRMAGLPADLPYPVRRVRLLAAVSSQLGRADYCRVTLEPGGARPLAISGASVLSSAVRADGFLLVPAASEGFPEGAEVDVRLYDASPWAP
ncbi:MAG: hypothetical protein HMLKMBBP_03622 [Planctomycetes bacterium]|nr:hypothetical protein [Planctomycetota bacterium]